MSDDQVNHQELYEGLKTLSKEVEAFADASTARVGAEIKREVRWLIVLSVGLNQMLNSVDLSQIAQASVAGSLLLAWGLKVLGLLSYGQ